MSSTSQSANKVRINHGIDDVEPEISVLARALINKNGDVQLDLSEVETAEQLAAILSGKPVTKAEAEAGTESGLRMYSPLRVAQAIAALASGGSSPKTFGITVDGGGQVLTTGSKGFVTIPYDCTITNWYLAADQIGDVTFDVKKAGTSIVGTGNFPLLSTVVIANAPVDGWTSVALTEGDVLEFEITGTPATITRVNLVIKAI